METQFSGITEYIIYYFSLLPSKTKNPNDCHMLKRLSEDSWGTDVHPHWSLTHVTFHFARRSKEQQNSVFKKSGVKHQPSDVWEEPATQGESPVFWALC